MARAMRRRSGLVKRRAADWVYRGRETDHEGSILTDLSSYDPSEWVTPAAPAFTGGILYDSRNYLMTATQGQGIVGGGFLPQAARAESGRRPTTWRVQGQILFRPSTWAAGSTMYFGIRIGVFEQDPQNGTILVPAGYSMFIAPTIAYQPSVWANQRRNNLWERRWFESFATANDQTTRTLRVNTSARARLNENECLAIILEPDVNSVSIRGRWWLRTLVSDDG